jgi:CheY-like chemotaxis protein
MIVTKKILIVEDDIFMQDFYRAIFKKIGGNYIILENATDIIEEVEKGDVGLIIMDINLRNTYLDDKRTDGIKFTRYLKQHFSNMKIPILLITAYPVSSLGENFLEESMADDYLIKPIVDYNKLIEKINKLVLNNYERQSTYS